MTWLLPSRSTVSRSRKRPTTSTGGPARRAWRPAAAGSSSASRAAAGAVSSGSAVEAEGPDRLARQRARAQDLHLAVDRGAVRRLAGGRHGGAGPTAGIGLDDQQRAGVVDRRHAPRGPPCRASPARNTQPSSSQRRRCDDLQQLGQRQLVVAGVRALAGRRRSGGARRPSRHNRNYSTEFNLYV